MLQSQLFPKTSKETPKDADNISTALLLRGGFIYKIMSGVYGYQPLGWRVLKNIEAIIRQEINAIGGQEIFMSGLQPKELWEKSGRWEKLKGDMYQFDDPSGRETGLAMTHEEPIAELIGQQPLSYQDFPITLHQFQTKYRYEPRAKSGLLRAREFIMNDLYSAHATEADLDAYYAKVSAAYARIFAAVEVPALETLASGGIFTPNPSHEFQAIAEIGEDTIYVCPERDYSVNKELIEQTGLTCPNHKVALEPHRAVEVGNIFRYGTKYAEDLGITFADRDGQDKPFWYGAYGIGLGRLMGVITELHHDERGIIWPKAVAPFTVHLLDLTKTDEEKAQAQAIYDQLTEAGIDVLFDDRAISAGAKFADADLLGMPYRAVVSAKTLAQGTVEVRPRTATEAEFMTLDALIDELKR